MILNSDDDILVNSNECESGVGSKLHPNEEESFKWQAEKSSFGNCSVYKYTSRIVSSEVVGRKNK